MRDISGVKKVVLLLMRMRTIIASAKAKAVKMLVKLVVSLSLLAAVVLVQGQEVVTVQPGPPDVCLEGPFHKDVPSPEEKEFHECLSWQNEACCNLELSMTIDRHKAVGLYNYSWDLCGTLSPECEEFIKVTNTISCQYKSEPIINAS